MKSFVKRLSAVFLAVLLLFSGCALLPEEEEEIAVPYVEKTIPQYKLHTVAKSGVESTFSTVGNVYKVVESTDTVYIEVWTANHSLVYPGMKVRCTYAGKDYTGTITFTSSAGQNARDYNFRETLEGVGIVVRGGSGIMKEGKTVSVYAQLAAKSGVLTVPTSAVKEYNGKTYVYVWDGLIRTEREVELGIRSAAFYEVVSGLEEGEQVTCK